jgi:XTP/dITP diphosphohydrolase
VSDHAEFLAVPQGEVDPVGSSVVVATRSAGKIRELLPLLSAHGVSVLSLSDLGIAESGEEESLEVYDTFEENALAKARWFSGRCGGRVVIADDSGLEVDALDGAPGVRSKRWGGFEALDGAALDAANNAHLLAMMARAAINGREERAARYVCAAACVWPDGALVVRGVAEGAIRATPQGRGGFGYDPFFESIDLGMSFAAATLEEKARVSHRGRAFRRLVAAMRADESLRTKLRWPVDPGQVRG